MTNPSEQSIEVRQQILDTLWLTEELLETPAHISITSNDINRLVALVDRATREARADEVGKFAMHLNTRMVQGLPSAWKIYTDKRLEELSNKEVE